jgi:hypothetical protein
MVDRPSFSLYIQCPRFLLQEQFSRAHLDYRPGDVAGRISVPMLVVSMYTHVACGAFSPVRPESRLRSDLAPASASPATTS